MDLKTEIRDVTEQASKGNYMLEEATEQIFALFNVSDSFNLDDLIEFADSVSFDGADKEDLIAFLNDR